MHAGMSSKSEPTKSKISSNNRRHRSRSTPRFHDVDKPKKKRHLGATASSLASIPSAIKLSMMNSGLLSSDQNGTTFATITEKPIELKDYIKFCDQRRKFPVLYKLEFQIAVKVEQHSCRHGTRKSNSEKNQNQRCIPCKY